MQGESHPAASPIILGAQTPGRMEDMRRGTCEKGKSPSLWWMFHKVMNQKTQKSNKDLLIYAEPIRTWLSLDFLLPPLSLFSSSVWSILVETQTHLVGNTQKHILGL